MKALERALPPNEWRAVSCWLSTFFPYQLLWLLDWSRFAYLLKARQIGASHTYAAACVLWGMLGETTTAVSRTELDSIELIKKSAKHADVLCRLGSRWAAGKARVLDFSFDNSGGRIVAASSEGAGRGMSGNVLLDEFAYHEHAEKVWDSASAVVMHGYRFRVLSTPNGVGNLFHQLCTDGKTGAGFTRHAVTLAQAREQGLTVDDAELWTMAHGDPRVYDQIFSCSFLDSEEQYIPTQLVKDACEASTSLAAGDTYAGLDIGLTNDLTALCVIRVAPDRRAWVQEVETCRRTDWDAQLKLIHASYLRWKWRRFAVDSTGLGAVPAQILVCKYGGQIVDGKPVGGIVEPVNFTPTVKEDLATTLYSAFANKRIAIPSGNAELREDICAIRRIITSAGNVRYDATRTDAGHADRAWAVALALHALSLPTPMKTRYGFASKDPV